MKHEIKMYVIKHFCDCWKHDHSLAIDYMFKVAFAGSKEDDYASHFFDIMNGILWLYPDSDYNFLAHILKTIGINVINDMEVENNA